MVIDPTFEKPPKVATMIWLPPPPTWIKVHIDGLSKNNLGLSACGGILEIIMEPSLAAGFGMFTGHQSSFYAIERAWAPKKKIFILLDQMQLL